MAIQIPDKLITLDEWSAIRKYLDTQKKGASDLYRDYFFHRNGAKGGAGLNGVSMYEALKVAEIILTGNYVIPIAS